jgi:hypothetical protein
MSKLLQLARNANEYCNNLIDPTAKQEDDGKAIPGPVPLEHLTIARRFIAGKSSQTTMSPARDD